MPLCVPRFFFTCPCLKNWNKKTAVGNNNKKTNERRVQMKKRWIDVMLAVAVCLGLSGCSSEETSSIPDLAQGPYANGSYEVKMPQYEGGW